MIDRRRRSLSSGSEVGKYQLREPIRIQNERALFEAYDPFLDRTVAIKILQLDNEGLFEIDKANHTFFAEARAIGRLQHQNIVSVYDAGMGDYEGYIVMEYVAGQSLGELLANKQVLSVQEALPIAKQICHALTYAHGKKIIHRDIKPSNIMVSDEGEVKLVDFGISIVRGTETTVPEFVGTPSYIAPELIDAGVPNALSDQFSLGVVLYEMLTGVLPFDGADIHGVLYRILYEQPAFDSEQALSLPVELIAVLKKCLSKNPLERYSSIRQLEAELDHLLADASATQLRRVAYL